MNNKIVLNIKNKIIILIAFEMLFVCLFAATSVFASNIGRTFYGIYSETYNGVHWNVSDDDGMFLYWWNEEMNFREPASDGSDIYRNLATISGIKEGKECKRFVAYTGTWDVVAYTPSSVRDMSSYHGGAIKFLARAERGSSSVNAEVGFQYNNDSDILFVKKLTDLGFVADGQWKEVSISLKSGDGISSDMLKNIKVFFAIRVNSGDNGNSVSAGDYIDIDNIRWVKADVTASLSITLKDVNTNTIATEQNANRQITWNKNAFRNGWVCAEQYLEFDDMDVDYTNLNNWYITVHTNNGSADKNGLVCNKNGLENKNKVLPMCWRIVYKPLPYYKEDGTTLDATTSIAENIPNIGDSNLYDSGVPTPAPGYTTWFYMKDSSSGDTNSDYVKILDFNKGGIHAQLNDNAENNEYPFWNLIQKSIDNCHPRLYLGANMSDALGGENMIYNTNIVITLHYE